MPLVFVHGVSTRTSTDYKEAEQARNELFIKITLADLVRNATTNTIRNPYWGRYGATFRWNNASLPRGNYQAMGPLDRLPLMLLGQTELPALGQYDLSDRTKAEGILVQIAQNSFEDAADVLLAIAADGAAGQHLSELGTFALKASEYAAQYSSPGQWPQWMNKIRTNDEFVTGFKVAVEAWTPPSSTAPRAIPGGWQALGTGTNIINGLLDGAGRITNAVLAWAAREKQEKVVWANRKLVNATRDSLHPLVATFAGDVFKYFDKRGDSAKAGDIVEEISGALRKAVRDKNANDRKLIAVGHSIGGVILYDILTSYATDLQIDALVTVGSQVAMFEEMKLFRASDSHLPTSDQPKVRKPPNVGCWINIFDRNDILSFVAGGVFSDVSDFEFVTGQGILSAHSSYFIRPSFHHRLRQRLAECWS